MKKISFSVDETEYNEIAGKAKFEGLTVSQFAKRATFLKAKKADSTGYICEPSETSGITCAEQALMYLDEIKNSQQECFLMLTLTTSNTVIKSRVITIGLLDRSQVHPREVFAPAIQDRCQSIIVAHNHPSGCVLPSNNDLAITKRIKSAGEIIGIGILDHIIIAPDGSYYSFQEHGKL